MPALKATLPDRSTTPANLFGRDEMNLAEYPLTVLTDTIKAGQKTLYFEDTHGRLTVTGSDAFGLPTASDADVIVALLCLTKNRNNFTDPKVNFTKYELLKILGWSDEGDSYKRLDQSFNRWGGVWLIYDKCWWCNRRRKYVSAKMHIIESVVFADSDGKHRDELPLSTFTWNQTFIDSCQADNLRSLDLEVYRNLKSALSKRLYRFLGKRFYKQSDWTFDLKDLAFERVGMSRSYADAGKIKEKLKPALDELEAIGFLEPLDRTARYRKVEKGQWTVRLGQKTTAQPAAPVVELVQPTANPLLTELTSRGVTSKTAIDLVEQHQADALHLKIEVFDWLVAKQDKRVAKSPAGYLVKSINDDYAAPKGYVSPAERDRQRQARQAEDDRLAASRRAVRETEAQEKKIKAKVAAHRQSLSTEQLAQIEAEAIAAASDEFRESLNSPAMRLFRQTLISRIIDEHLARTLADA